MEKQNQKLGNQKSKATVAPPAVKKKKPTEVTTPKFRASFAHVFKPHAFEGQEPKYSIAMLFEKDGTDLTDLKRAVAAAATAEWGERSKWPQGLKLPFRDGDEKSDLAGYEGTTFCSASSKSRPQVIDQKLNPIVAEDESFYSGCYARATLIAYAWSNKFGKGVSFSLQNLQKLGDGEQFSGRRNATEEFDAVEDDSEDPANYDGSDDEEPADEYDIGDM